MASLSVAGLCARLVSRSRSWFPATTVLVGCGCPGIQFTVSFPLEILIESNLQRESGYRLLETWALCVSETQTMRLDLWAVQPGSWLAGCTICARKTQGCFRDRCYADGRSRLRSSSRGLVFFLPNRGMVSWFRCHFEAANKLLYPWMMVTWQDNSKQ